MNVTGLDPARQRQAVAGSLDEGGILLGLAIAELMVEVGDGKVELPTAQLTIGANGVVRAEVNAKAVVVVGRCTGNVNGSERVEIQATGVVEGDVHAPRLVVAEGAVINGSIHMTQQARGAQPQAGGSAPTPDARKTA